jgi:hypothetical protein
MAFQGRCVTSGNQAVPTFSLSLEGAAFGAAPAAASVSTKTDGAYEVRLPINRAVLSSSLVLGDATEQVKILVSANGYKAKRFVVKADQLFVRKPNKLNVVLQPVAATP